MTRFQHFSTAPTYPNRQMSRNNLALMAAGLPRSQWTVHLEPVYFGFSGLWCCTTTHQPLQWAHHSTLTLFLILQLLHWCFFFFLTGWKKTLTIISLLGYLWLLRCADKWFATVLSCGLPVPTSEMYRSHFRVSTNLFHMSLLSLVKDDVTLHITYFITFCSMKFAWIQITKCVMLCVISY